MSSARRVLLLLLAAIALVAFSDTLAHRSLWSPDEGRYAEIGREMMVSGDWVTPRLNAARYFEKPPLVYWAIATSLSVCGVNELAARLPAVLAAIALVAATAWLGTMTVSRRAGLMAAAFIAANPMVFVLGQVVVLDTPLAALLALALCCAWRGFSGDPANERGWRRWPLLSAAFLALATLTKGPIAVVLGGMVLAPLLVFEQNRPAVRAAPWIWMAILFLAITAPWFVLVSRKNPDFLRFFFIHEHFDRYLKSDHARPGPPWYFVAVLIFGFFPWSGLIPAALRSLLRAHQEDSPALANAKGEDVEPLPQTLRPMAAWFLGAWVLLPLAFFSLSRSKLPPYILPVFPALAVLLAAGLEPLLDREPPRAERRLMLCGSGFAVALLLAVVYKACTFDAKYYHDLAGIWFQSLFPLVGCTLMAMAAFVACGRGDARGGVQLLFAVVVVGLSGATRIAPYYEPIKDSRVLATEILARRAPGERVAIYGTLESSSALPFYLQEPVVIAGHFFGELTMARTNPKPDEIGRFLTAHEIQGWMEAGQPRAWFVTAADVYDEYFGPHPRFRTEVIRRHGNRLLFVNK